MNRVRQATWWWAPVVVGAALRVYGLQWGLPDPLEEATPFFRAWGMWNWNDGSGLDFDPGFYRYPSLVFYVHWLLQAGHVALASLGGGEDAVRWIPAHFVLDRGPLLLLARTVGAAFGVGMVAGTFALGRSLGGRTAGGIAALAVAVNALLIRQAQMIEVDTVSACLVTWGLWACVGVARDGTRRHYLWAGALLGLATSAKYPGAFLLVPIVWAHAVRWRDLAGDAPARIRIWGFAGLAAVVAFASFAATSPFVLLNLERAWADVAAERAHMASGHFGGEVGSAYLYYAGALARWILGPIGALAAVLGAVLVVRKRHAAAVPMIVFVITLLAVVGSWTMRADRYVLLVVPALWVLASLPVAELLRRQRWVGLGVALALIVSSAWGLPAVYERNHPDTRALARDWIEENIPEGAFLLLEAWGPNLLDPEALWADLRRDARRRVLESAERPLYAVQLLPMFQVAPELSEAFYELSLYSDVDVVVLSSDVSERHRREPDRFAKQLEFYEALDQAYVHVITFDESSAAGPTISIYLRKNRRTVFAQRAEQDGPQALNDALARSAEGEAAWFQHLALNYETFGFMSDALSAYARALGPPRVPPSVAIRAGKGMARCHFHFEDPGAAAAALNRAGEVCAGSPESRALLRMAAELRNAP